jgi:hypothetical protein
MMFRRSASAVALSVAASLLSAACGGGQSAPSPATATPGSAVAPAPLLLEEPERALPPPVAYGGSPRRDPFKATVRAAMDAGKGPALDGFKLVGVMSGSTGWKALVEGPDGIGYILKPGDVLGPGRVTEIRGDQVRLALAASRTAQPVEVTLRLETD